MIRKIQYAAHRAKRSLRTTYRRAANLPSLLAGTYRGFSDDLGISFEYMVIPTETFEPSGKSIIFNPDFLPDHASWSGTNFRNSPHIEFAREYLETPDFDYRTTKYYKLGLRGRLPFPTIGKSMASQCRAFTKLIDAIRDNGYDPKRFGAITLIPCQDGTIMTLNGKHRLAALLALGVDSFDVAFCFSNEVKALYHRLVERSWPSRWYQKSLDALDRMGQRNLDSTNEIQALISDIKRKKLETWAPIYHPIPFLEFENLDTQVGFETPYRRLGMILSKMDSLCGKRVLDLGSNLGFYSFSLAKRGADVVSVELRPEYTEIESKLSELYGLPIEIHNRPITPEFLDTEGPFDVTLCFSMLQWVMAEEGREYGEQLLRKISEHSKALFFDISVNMGKANLNAPAGQERDFVHRLLRTNTVYDHIEHVGDVHPYKIDTRHVFFCR